MMSEHTTQPERIPVSVTTHGIYTVTIWDEEAYQENIRTYYPDTKVTPARSQPVQRTKYTREAFTKRKRTGNYSWDSAFTRKRTA